MIDKLKDPLGWELEKEFLSDGSYEKFMKNRLLKIIQKELEELEDSFIRVSSPEKKVIRINIIPTLAHIEVIKNLIDLVIYGTTNLEKD